MIINETSFFRHPSQFDALEHVLLADLVAQRRREGGQRMRLWNAACATGDDAYTLAILVKERMQPRFPDMQFQIVATDADTHVLAAARAAHYHARAVRNVPAAYLYKFFRRSGDAYILDPTVRQMVSFRRLDLLDEQAMLGMRSFDVILCANVLICFEEAATSRILSAMGGSLRPGGCLFMGPSETQVKLQLVPGQVAGALVYQRPLALGGASQASDG